jgi:hypothetical protein
VLRTTLGGRPPPRVPFVSASCREQAQTILKRLRRPRVRKGSPIELLQSKTKEVSYHRPPETFAGFYATPNIRSARCMVIFHNKINKSLETLASCRHRVAGLAAGAYPLQGARSTWCCERWQAADNEVAGLAARLRRPRKRKVLQIELLEPKHKRSFSSSLV